MAEQKSPDRRRYLRYPPDPTETVMIQVGERQSADFRPQLAALPSEESRNGLRLVLRRHEMLDGIEAGSRLLVEVARLGPQQARVRWVDSDHDEVVTMGVELLPE
ncbi:MAG: hypothetical protein ACOCSR_03355 [Wenzhouxiangella sp.]